MTVYLVGAGPGDPGLLTVRALEVLRRADVVVYDRLSQESLLDLAPPGAERIDVGKAPGPRPPGPGGDQRAARRAGPHAGQRSCGSRAATRSCSPAAARRRPRWPPPACRSRWCRASRRPSPCPPTPASRSRCGTRRRASRSSPATRSRAPARTARSTGRPSPGSAARSSCSWAWPASGASPPRSWPAGRSPDTPVAAVQWGTRPEQRTVRATLGTIGDGRPRHAVDHRGGRRRRLRPGAGSRTGRCSGGASWSPGPGSRRARWSTRLAALGAATVEVPAIAIGDPADGGAALAAAVERLAGGAYDWVVVTSPNGAERLLAAVRDAGRDARAFGGRAPRRHRARHGRGAGAGAPRARPRARAVRRRGAARRLPGRGARRAGGAARPRRGGARRAARGAGGHGAGPSTWSRPTAPSRSPLDEARRAALAGAEVVTFTSSSTVTNFLAAVGADAVPPVVAAIGPVTAATAREHGLTVDVEAEVHTIDGLVDALVAWAADHPALAATAPGSAARGADLRLRRADPRHRDVHLRGGRRDLRRARRGARRGVVALDPRHRRPPALDRAARRPARPAGGPRRAGGPARGAAAAGHRGAGRLRRRRRPARRGRRRRGARRGGLVVGVRLGGARTSSAWGCGTGSGPSSPATTWAATPPAPSRRPTCSWRPRPRSGRTPPAASCSRTRPTGSRPGAPPAWRSSPCPGPMTRAARLRGRGPGGGLAGRPRHRRPRRRPPRPVDPARPAACAQVPPRAHRVCLTVAQPFGPPEGEGVRPTVPRGGAVVRRRPRCYNRLPSSSR